MGIQGLTGLILENAPEGYQEIVLSSLSGQIIAIDASMTLYQFMIAIRQGNFSTALVNSEGETTSHIAGLMSRVATLLTLGIRPVYVFDGKPPEAKSETLLKRKEKKLEAEKLLEKAIESTDIDEIRKQTSRTVRVSKEQSKLAMEFLQLCGLPVVEAAQEAEAQCAYMVKWGIADAASTEDTDCLTFGTPILIRNLSNALSIVNNKNSRIDSKSPKRHLLKFNLKKTLEGFKIDHNQFIDLCILCGCDYCGKLKGIGPKTALTLIQKYKTIEAIIANKKIANLGDSFDYQLARREFLNPKVLPRDSIKMEWKEPNIPQLIEFLVAKNNFNQDRVNKFINRLINAKKIKPQQQISSFFTFKTDVKNDIASEIPTKSPNVKTELEVSTDKYVSQMENSTDVDQKTAINKEIAQFDSQNSTDSVDKSERKRAIMLLQFCPKNVKVKKGAPSTINCK